MFVVICGLPGSGNRLLKALVQAAGGDAIVRHGNTGAKYLCKAFRNHSDCRAIIPVRHWRAETASNPWAKSERQKDDCVREVIRALAGHPDVPVRMIGYEALFLYPEQSKYDLLSWLGLDPLTAWPEPPRDENAKWIDEQ